MRKLIPALPPHLGDLGQGTWPLCALATKQGTQLPSWTSPQEPHTVWCDPWLGLGSTVTSMLWKRKLRQEDPRV